MSMSIFERDESRHDFAFLAGVIVGAISGALVTLALTPMSGSETREKLRSRAEELGPVRERAVGMAAPVREKAAEVAAPVREKAGTLATTAAERAQTIAATGKERAAELAAKAPIRRSADGTDASDVDPATAEALIDPSDPNAHPGGAVTPGALAEAGGSATAAAAEAAAETPPRAHAPRAHAQEPAEGERGPATESGNGRVSETPGGVSRPDANGG